MATAAASPAPAIESIGTDWLSNTYAFIPGHGEPDHLAWCYDMASRLLPGEQWSEPRPSRNFRQMTKHPVGIVVQQGLIGVRAQDFKEVEAELASITWSGDFWGSLQAEEASTALQDLLDLEGYVRTTRWDIQTTVTHPVVDATQFADDVQAGRLFPVGFGRVMDYRERDQDRQTVGGVTTYFGGRQSDKRVRVYDKQIEDNRPDPTLRVEMQLRNEIAGGWIKTAAHAMLDAQAAGLSARMGEVSTVKRAMAQEFDLRDTSRWAGGQRPKNWARDAGRPDWWVQLIDMDAPPVPRPDRHRASLDRARQVVVEQYGRKLAAWAYAQVLQREVDMEDLAIEFWDDVLSCMDDDQWDALLSRMPAADSKWCRLQRKAWRNPLPPVERQLP